MTKYLVSHEFGHCIQYNLQQILEIEREDFEKEYAKNIRKIAEAKIIRISFKFISVFFLSFLLGNISTVL